MNTLSITKLKLTFVDQSQIKLFLMNLVKILLAVIVLHWTVSCEKRTHSMFISDYLLWIIIGQTMLEDRISCLNKE